MAEPEVHLTHRLHLGELGEDERDRLRNAPIRILLDAVVADPHVADGDRHEQLAAARLLLQGFERALAQHRQLHLAHGALHAEQQAIVGMARIVDAVLVDDQRADETAELQQRVPVAAVAGEPRRLDRDHGADASLADGGQQLLEAGPRDAAAGAAEIVIDDGDIAPAELPRAIGKTVLAALALQIVGDLIGGRLTDVDDGLTGEVLRRDLAHAAASLVSWSLSRVLAVAAVGERLDQQALDQADERRSSAPPEYPASCDPPRTSLRCRLVSWSHDRLLRRGADSPSEEARSASSRARSSTSRSTDNRGQRGESCGASRLLAHPGRDQGECPVGLDHDQMILAGEPLAVHDLHHLPGTEDGTDRGSAPRTPDTRHCDAVSTGTGKTHIGLGLGLAACQKGLSVGFTTAAALVHELLEARDEKRLLRLQRQLAGYKLLIIDELGYVPLSQTGAELLFEVFSQRYERGSTVVTSNLPFDEWTSVFGSERLTGALLDRLTHHVHILQMNGDSYRLNQSKHRSRHSSSDTPADYPNQA